MLGLDHCTKFASRYFSMMQIDMCQDLYKEMIASHVKPSVATFSILIRLYAQCALERVVAQSECGPVA